MTFKTKTKLAKYLTIDDWNKHCAGLPDIDRPIVLSIDERKKIVKIRPKTVGEILSIQKDMIKRGLRQGSFSDMVPPTFEVSDAKD
jgi:hypothetical protein